MKFNKHFYKISIRCILAVLVTIATVVLILSGNSIGYVNSLIVFGALSICGPVLICIELVYLLSLSIYNTRRSKAINVGGSVANDIRNFERPILTRNEKLQQRLDLFLLKNKLANISNSAAERRNRCRMKKTFIVRYADLMTDLFMFLVYLIILTLIILSSRDSFAFYSTRASIRQFMNRRYFNNQTREPVDIELFLGYLRHDFLPTIHTGKRKWHVCPMKWEFSTNCQQRPTINHPDG